MPKTILRTEAQFKEVNNTGVFIAEIEANHAKSIELLQQHKLEPMEKQEALVLIDGNPELKEQLKGNWFYLAGKGLEESGYYTFDNEGKLTEGKGDIEKTVRAYSGNEPLSLFVRTHSNARVDEGRFYLDADGDPQDAAPVVVGVRVGHEVAMPKIEVSEADEGVKLTGITSEQLMALCRDSEQELSKVAEVFGSDNLLKTRMLVAALRIKE